MRHFTRFLLALACLLGTLAATSASPPTASYIFPAGGQRGTTVKVRVGGLFLHETCRFAVGGTGLAASPTLTRARAMFPARFSIRCWCSNPRLYPASSLRVMSPQRGACFLRP
jgi:hypothetical protein